jgi:hypothetical protein
MIQRIIAISALLTVLVSCDKRQDYWELRNETPGIPISTSANFWSHNDDYRFSIDDSVKIGFNYHMSYAKWDDSESLEIKISDPAHGTMDIDGDAITYDEYFVLPHNYGVINYTPTDIGFESIQIMARDNYGKETTTSVDLFVFENFLPEAALTVTHVNNIDYREYEIDASQSYDPDAAYGGGVIGYEYSIDTDTTFYPYNKMSYVFPANGTYVVSVRLMDNDSTWGAYATLGGFNVN